MREATRQPPSIDGLVGMHHVAYAVTDLDAGIELWSTMVGAELELRRTMPDQQVEAASLVVAGSPMLELIAPIDEASGVARFLVKRGPGMHHVAWEVVDVARALNQLAASGVQLIDAEPRAGLHGTPVAFVHPRSMGGVLTELVQSL